MTNISARNESTPTFYAPATPNLPRFMPPFTCRGYGHVMAVLRRETSRVHLPADFGLGLAVTTVIGGLLLLALAMADGLPTRGPRTESREPNPETTYFEPSGAGAAPSLVPSH